MGKGLDICNFKDLITNELSKMEINSYKTLQELEPWSSCRAPTKQVQDSSSNPSTTRNTVGNTDSKTHGKSEVIV
jgi:hypothetical protein